MISERIIEAIQGALTTLGLEGVVVLEHPGDLSHGDYSTNIALAVAKKAGKNPRVLAEEIVQSLGSIDGVQKIETAGAGFINFHLTRSFFSESISAITESGESWGSNATLKGKKIIVEYSQPNPFKPFHIGHLMSTTVGEAISRLVEWSGADIYRANYQGDIGPHVAKGIWGLQKNNLNPSNIQDLGDAYVIGNTAYEDDPASKAEIDSINKRLYEGDASLQDIYDKGRKASLAHFEDLYRVLGTKFDEYFFESNAWRVGLKIVEEGKSRGIFEESDGATVFKGEKVGLHTRVFVTSKGTPTYEAKELGLAQMKQQSFPFDLNVTTIAVEQDGYFKVVEAAMAELWPDMAGKYTHTAFGMMQLTSGKMSSRKGNIITGESLIEDMRAKALAKMEGRVFESEEIKQDVADSVAIAGIKYSILKQSTGKNIIFDPEASLSFEGDSGPYLQYSYVRARAVLRKARAEKIPALASDLIYQISELIPEVSELERTLYRFPEIVERAQVDREPHHITTFLTELASAFNSWYATGKIVDSTDTLSPYKVALTRVFALTMQNGLTILGIRAPEAM
ncbi:arginine--tRNA ligase [Patescibacteria group bacterium]|nr:MAG: arginine--tRNA ligase [Patescibacteria group bacterium]